MTPPTPQFEPQLSQFELLESPPPSRPWHPLRVLVPLGTLVILFVVGILAYAEVQADWEARKATETRDEVLLQSHQIRIQLNALEAALQNIPLTGDFEAIAAADRVSDGLDVSVARLREQLKTPEARAQLGAIERTLDSIKLAADQQIGARADSLQTALAAARRGELRGLVERAFLSIEEPLTVATEPRRYRSWLIALLAGSTIASTIVALLGIRLYRRADKAAKEVAKKHVALRRHTLYLSSVVEAIPGVLFAQAADGSIRIANRATAEIFGLPTEQAVGGRNAKLPPPGEDLERLVEQVRQVLQTGEETAALRRLQHPATNEERWFETRVVPWVPPTADGPQALVFGSDLTERVRAELMIRGSHLEILRRLAEVAEFRDADTGQHTRRVARLGAAIARMLGLSPDEVELIEQAAPFHDIGKIGIPDSILLKPASLTPREFEVMKTHTIIGAKLLSGRSSELLSMAERICLMHHERWDGSGYPSGLRQDETPTAAQVIWVADAVDSLAHPRRHRPAWPHEFILAQLKIERGRKFGPECVDACLELLTAKDGRERWIGDSPPKLGRTVLGRYAGGESAGMS